MRRRILIALAALVCACDVPGASDMEECQGDTYSAEDVTQLLSEQECTHAFDCVTICLGQGWEASDCGGVCDVAAAMPGGYCESNDCSNVPSYVGAMCALEPGCGIAGCFQ